MRIFGTRIGASESLLYGSQTYEKEEHKYGYECVEMRLCMRNLLMVPWMPSQLRQSIRSQRREFGNGC